MSARGVPRRMALKGGPATGPGVRRARKPRRMSQRSNPAFGGRGARPRFGVQREPPWNPAASVKAWPPSGPEETQAPSSLGALNPCRRATHGPPAISRWGGAPVKLCSARGQENQRGERPETSGLKARDQNRALSPGPRRGAPPLGGARRRAAAQGCSAPAQNANVVESRRVSSAWLRRARRAPGVPGARRARRRRESSAGAAGAGAGAMVGTGAAFRRGKCC